MTTTTGTNGSEERKGTRALRPERPEPQQQAERAPAPAERARRPAPAGRRVAAAVGQATGRMLGKGLRLIHAVGQRIGRVRPTAPAASGGGARASSGPAGGSRAVRTDIRRSRGRSAKAMLLWRVGVPAAVAGVAILTLLRTASPLPEGWPIAGGQGERAGPSEVGMIGTAPGEQGAILGASGLTASSQSSVATGSPSAGNRAVVATQQANPPQAARAGEPASLAAGQGQAELAAGSPSVQSAEALFSWPVQGEVASPMGWRRHPVFGDWRFVPGAEVAVEPGSEIRASAAGKVAAVAADTETGFAITLDHGNGWTSLYQGLARVYVTEGQAVASGQALGRAPLVRALQRAGEAQEGAVPVSARTGTSSSGQAPVTATVVFGLRYNNEPVDPELALGPAADAGEAVPVMVLPSPSPNAAAEGN